MGLGKITDGTSGGGGGGGGGSVVSVTATDASIVVAGTSTAPTVATGTLDAIATAHPPVASVALNAQKITGLANGSSAQDAAAFGQIPTSVVSQFTTSTITGNTTAAAGTYYRCNGTFNLTLPASPATGAWVLVKSIASGQTVTIVGTVDGNAALTITTQYQAYWFVYNGATWDIV